VTNQTILRHEHACDVAVRAALAAARLIRSHAGRLADGQVREKAAHDLVTVIDEEAQRIIVGALKAAYPNHAVLAEEDADPGALLAAPEGPCWIIDPIDGTTNFTHGFPPYAVSIGLQVDGVGVVGVVLDVSRDELFTAVRGGGVYMNGAPVAVSRRMTLAESLITFGLPYRVVDQAPRYLVAIGELMRATRGIRRSGSAATDLANVACGRLDGFFETGLMPWDMAAGMVLIQEGGGRVTDFSGGPDPVFTRDIVATNGAIHPALLEIVAGWTD
jgi:myo-inositol-1(or 4)-monophosphatase